MTETGKRPSAGRLAEIRTTTASVLRRRAELGDADDSWSVMAGDLLAELDAVRLESEGVRKELFSRVIPPGVPPPRPGDQLPGEVHVAIRSAGGVLRDYTLTELRDLAREEGRAELLAEVRAFAGWYTDPALDALIEHLKEKT